MSGTALITDSGGRVVLYDSPAVRCRIESFGRSFEHARVLDDHDELVGMATLEMLDPAKAPKPNGPPSTSAIEKLKGLAGLARAEMGLDALPPDTIMARQVICEACGHNDFGRCMRGGCNCYLWAKIRAAGQRCPMGKWGSGPI